MEFRFGGSTAAIWNTDRGNYSFGEYAKYNRSTVQSIHSTELGSHQQSCLIHLFFVFFFFPYPFLLDNISTTVSSLEVEAKNSPLSEFCNVQKEWTVHVARSMGIITYLVDISHSAIDYIETTQNNECHVGVTDKLQNRAWHGTSLSPSPHISVGLYTAIRDVKPWLHSQKRKHHRFIYWSNNPKDWVLQSARYGYSYSLTTMTIVMEWSVVDIILTNEVSIARFLCLREPDYVHSQAHDLSWQIG